jgi:hypothetical protein
VAGWSRTDLINRSFAWFKIFPRALRAEFANVCWTLTEKGGSYDHWRAADEPTAGVQLLGQQMMAELTAGSGVAFLTGIIPPGAYVPDDFLRWAYRRIATQIGDPIGANGGMLDLGGRRRCYRPERAQARGSAGETSFHTDSLGAAVPDVVGMLCLSPAKIGGEWQVSSAVRAHELLRRNSGDLLRRLYDPFVREVAAPASGLPVFSRDAMGWGLRFQYMRYGIESERERSGLPLAPPQREALDRLDQTLNEASAAVQFRLRRGEMIFVNNRLVAHNRRNYIDHPDPGQSRKMVRMWLSLQEDWLQWEANGTFANTA